MNEPSRLDIHDRSFTPPNCWVVYRSVRRVAQHAGHRHQEHTPDECPWDGWDCDHHVITFACMAFGQERGDHWATTPFRGIEVCRHQACQAALA